MTTKGNVLPIGFAIALLASSATAEGPWTGAGDYYLQPGQIAKLRQSAMRGDVGAANRLANYFSIYEGSHIQGEFWLRVAAENGDCKAANEMSYRFETALSRNEKEIAYWRSRLIDLGCAEKAQDSGRR